MVCFERLLELEQAQKENYIDDEECGEQKSENPFKLKMDDTLSHVRSS